MQEKDVVEVPVENFKSIKDGKEIYPDCDQCGCEVQADTVRCPRCGFCIACDN